MKLRNLMSGLLALTLPLQSLAAASDDALAQLRAELAALSQRLNALESENAQLRETSMTTVKEIAVNREQVARIAQDKSAASWTDTIKLKGDFRYRYENIDEEGREERDRNRIRARANLEAKLPQNVKVVLGLATGGDDPVSANQTLGGGGSSKDIKLNLAYADWEAIDGLHLIGGKFKNVWHRPGGNGLLFDSDYNPEGLALVYSDDSGIFANLAGTWLESDTRRANNSYSWGGQLGFQGDFAGASFKAGGGYYNMETKGKSTFYGGDDVFFGNSFECSSLIDLSSCVYLYDYNMVQGFVDVGMHVGDLPLTFFADYVVNDDADDNDTGYAFGTMLGEAKAPGSWEVGYTYQDLERDAVLALITDSNFGGGGTGAKGHIFRGTYAMNKSVTVGFRYFRNEVTGILNNDRDYDRFMLDTQFKY
jgi:hypothetical protein